MPAYSNFDEAYAASGIDLFMMSIKSSVGWTNYYEIQGYIDASDWYNAFIKVQKVLQMLLGALDYFVDVEHGTLYENAFNDCSYWNDTGLSGVEVTWQAICEAWIKNDFEGRALTIATIDRMRQILWDEPFFVAWASRPEEQSE